WSSVLCFCLLGIFACSLLKEIYPQVFCNLVCDWILVRKPNIWRDIVCRNGLRSRAMCSPTSSCIIGEDSELAKGGCTNRQTDIFFHSLFCSYSLGVPIIVEGT